MPETLIGEKNWQGCCGLTHWKELHEITCVTRYGGFGKLWKQPPQLDYYMLTI
jgi:hypothetical protein